MKLSFVVSCQALSLLFAAHTAAAGPVKPAIPLAFQGEWYTELQACTGNIPLDGIRISGTLLEYGEASSNVLKVRILSPIRIKVYTADFGEETPGDPGNAAARHSWTTFTLGNTGQSLQETTQVGGKPHTFTFVRCYEIDHPPVVMN